MNSPRSNDKAKVPYPPSRLHAQKSYNNDQGFIEVANYHHALKCASLERRIQALEKTALPDDKDLRSLKKVYHDTLHVHQKGMKPWTDDLARKRDHLQQRYNEEAALLSQARSEECCPYNLAHDVCERIAGINNKPATWDGQLKKPPYTGGPKISQKFTQNPRFAE